MFFIKVQNKNNKKIIMLNLCQFYFSDTWSWNLNADPEPLADP